MTEETIFAIALEKQTPAERRAYLDEVCAGNPQLRAQVEELLRADADAGSFLNHPPAGVDATIVTSAEHDTATDKELELSLSFLQPCSTPGRLGKLVGKVGEYEVIEIVGQGGMGAVLRAFDTKLSRIVAVKIMAAELAANPMAVKRFLREAQSAAAIHHEHVVTIHAIDDTHRPPFIVMQYVEGLTLQQKIDNQGALELKQVLRIGSQMAAGLAAAHKHGLIHRDVKPANVLLENGVERVKITDFGLARAADDLEMTQTGIIAGTPQYMSPEQARGEPVDARSDLFSLGSVLYTMCTGRPAFRAETTMGVLKRVCDEEPRLIREVNPEVPEWLAAIIGKLLEKNPADRFQAASEVAELLSQHLAHLQNPAHTPLPAPIPVPAPATFVPPAAEPKPDQSSIAERKHRKSLVAATLLWGLIAVGLGIAAVVILPIVMVALPAIQRVRALSSNAILEVQCDENVHHAVVQVKKRDEVVATIDTRSEATAIVPEGNYRLEVASASWRTPDSLPDEGDYVYDFSVQISPSSRFLQKGRRHQIFVERTSVKRRRDNQSAPADSRQTVDRFTQLFNGRDLAGWTPYSAEPADWKVAQGELVGRRGFLFSERADFEDFHLRVEAMINPSGNSGLSFRTSSKWSGFSETELPFRGYEAEIADYQDVQTGSLSYPVQPGDMMRRAVHKDRLAPAGEWFTMEVIARGNHIVIRVNDHEVVNHVDPSSSFRQGHLMLHTFNPLTVVKFRKIEIKELPPAEPGWLKLFNGSELTGWKTHPDQPGFWKVEGGELVGFGATSHLFTERGDYEDFHLRVEAKINDGGGSGVYFRVPEFATTRYGAFPNGYEANINCTHAMDEDKTGSLTGNLRGAAPFKTALHKPDEWFTMEVLAQGPHIVIRVNDQTTADFVDANDSKDRFRRGHLALQVWPPNSVVRFRKIEIKELPVAAPAQGPPNSLTMLWGKEKDGWQAGIGWKGGKQRFAAGEPVEFELKVRNTTDAERTIEIDKPDGWDLWYSGGGELQLRIFGGKKEKLTLAAKEERTIEVPGAQIKTEGLNKGFYKVRFSTPFDGKERDLADPEFGFFLDREDPQPFPARGHRTEALKHPDEQYASVAWGEPVLGLSFGWQRVDREEELNAIEFFLWNTSAAAVQVKYLEHHPLDWQILLRDKDGKEIRSEQILTGPKVEANKRLAAGAVVSLGVTTVDQLWRAAGTPRDNLPAGTYKASSWFNCTRTDYGHLGLRLISGEAPMDIKNP